MQDGNFCHRSASLDVKLHGKTFTHPFFHLLFVSLFDHAIVRAYRMRMFKKIKTSHAGPVEE